MFPFQNPSAPSPDLNTLPFSVAFDGWRFANTKFKLWAKIMAALHEPVWRKAGIFEAVTASTYKIFKNTDLVLGIAEKWCPDTKTFVLPWGETTITLEDVMLLLGFSVLGSPVFATLDSSGEEILAKLKKEWLKIKKDKVSFVTQVAWMKRFMYSEDELEHVAFLVLWLSYFVFPSRFYHLSEAILPIAVHLSSGTKIALAPAVLAHLYAELSLLKTHIRNFSKSPLSGEVHLNALFKLVQVWTWERFRELQPQPNPLLEGEPRLALWNDLKQRTNDARHILDNSEMDSFEWRPYTKTVKNWKFPQFYPEKAMTVPVCSNLDEFISFARCMKESQLVGMHNVEHYFPSRVASQFGMLQDVPSLVDRNNLSREAAWNDYNKPINDMELYIPSRSAIPRVTPTFCEWWRKTSAEFQYSSKEKDVVESTETLNARNIIGNYSTLVPSGTSKYEMNIAEDSNKSRKHMNEARAIGNNESSGTLELRNIVGDHSSFVLLGSNRTNKDEMKKAEDSNKSRKYVRQDRKNDESTMGLFQTQVPSENDEEVDSLTVAQRLRLNKKYSGEDASEPLGILEEDNNDYVPSQKFALIRHGTVQPPETEQRNEESDESGSKAGKSMVVSPFDENNSSDPPFGANERVLDNAVLPPKKRKTCDDDLDIYGSNVDLNDDGNKEPKCLLQEDGIIAGKKASSYEKLCNVIKAGKEVDVVDDDSLIQKKVAIDELALKANNNKPSPRQKFATGGANGYETSRTYKSKVLIQSDESDIHISVGDETHGRDCLLHDDSLGSEETMKSHEDLEKSNNGLGEGSAGNDSYEKSFQELKMVALSL